ncbi:LysR family transcriptional regulator [Paenibacillus sp. TC-CSREp1]|uniref:LysR family transcriptional regulator n=1 Tax=Paenibacillus sp. TC-CSREp1 TaxID=3410089 RepID=UPI003D066A6D
MSFRTIEYFIAVAEHGSLSRAAHHLHITQPALSKQIQLFEKELGYRLFIRSHQGMSLTDHGRNLFEDIHPIVHTLRNKMNEHRKIEKIRFGVSPFLATYYLPELEGEIPIELTITKEECFEFITMLESGKIDAAIVQDYPNHTGLFSKFLYEEEFQIVVPKGHPLTKSKAVTLQDCLKYPQVLPPKESRLYNNIESFIEEKEIRPKKVISVPYTIIIDYVIKGYGITYLPSLMIKDHYYEHLQFVRFKDAALIRKLYLFSYSQHILDMVWHQLHHHSINKV